MASAERKPGNVFRHHPTPPRRGSRRRPTQRGTSSRRHGSGRPRPRPEVLRSPWRERHSRRRQREQPHRDRPQSVFQTRRRHVGGRHSGNDQEQRIQRKPADPPVSRTTESPEPSTNSSSASVEAYCPYDAGKIASIAAYTGRGSPDVVVVLASLTEALPAGEIPPTKPLPVPAAPPPPPPEELAPAPQQPPPPPPRHVQQAPQRQQQVEPPPQEAPPQEAPPQEPPPQAEQPQAPAPAPEPGGGNGGAPAPESPSPAPPAPPGHIRLAP